MNLDRKVRWTFIATFAMGLVTGMYLYLIGFAPAFSNLFERELGEVFEGRQLAIVGEMYGGCDEARSCAAFRLEGNGSYRYLPRSSGSREVSSLSGTLPSELWRELLGSLDATNLSARAREVEPNGCASDADGLDYLYEITRAGEAYVLDTCGTDFSRASELGRALEGVWRYLETRDR